MEKDPNIECARRLKKKAEEKIRRIDALRACGAFPSRAELEDRITKHWRKEYNRLTEEYEAAVSSLHNMREQLELSRIPSEDECLRLQVRHEDVHFPFHIMNTGDSDCRHKSCIGVIGFSKQTIHSLDQTHKECCGKYSRPPALDYSFGNIIFEGKSVFFGSDSFSEDEHNIHYPSPYVAGNFLYRHRKGKAECNGIGYYDPKTHLRNDEDLYRITTQPFGDLNSTEITPLDASETTSITILTKNASRLFRFRGEWFSYTYDNGKVTHCRTGREVQFRFEGEGEYKNFVRHEDAIDVFYTLRDYLHVKVHCGCVVFFSLLVSEGKGTITILHSEV